MIISTFSGTASWAICVHLEQFTLFKGDFTKQFLNASVLLPSKEHVFLILLDKTIFKDKCS